MSNSNLSNYDIYNPYITGILFWQAHNIALINTYNEFLRTWTDNITLAQIAYENN